jgi:hypothetical protein
MSRGSSSSVRAEVRAEADRAEAAPLFETLARAGFVADGGVHVLVGVLAIVVSLGGRGETNQPGALRAIAGAPLGFVVLWLAALALAALAVWHVLDGVLAHGSPARRKWSVRLTSWGNAAVFCALAATTAAVAIGARPDPDESVQDASRGLLAVPGGPFVVGAVGIAIGVSGVVFAVIGLRRRFVDGLALPSDRVRRVVTSFAVVGYVAKGVALLTVAVLLVAAAVKIEPDDAGGLDAALGGLIALPLGPLVCGAIGAGLIAYGGYLVLSARYRRL